MGQRQSNSFQHRNPNRPSTYTPPNANGALLSVGGQSQGSIGNRGSRKSQKQQQQQQQPRQQHPKSAAPGFHTQLTRQLNPTARLIQQEELEYGSKAGRGAAGEVYFGRFRGVDVAIKRTDLQADVLNDEY